MCFLLVGMTWFKFKVSVTLSFSGTNGGISLVGTLASFVGGVLVGGAFYLSLLLLCNRDYLTSAPPQWPIVPLGGLFGAVGSLVDSLLGATFQYSGKDFVFFQHIDF